MKTDTNKKNIKIYLKFIFLNKSLKVNIKNVTFYNWLKIDVYWMQPRKANKSRAARILSSQFMCLGMHI